MRSGAGDGCLHRGDVDSRRGASSRRCNVVDDRMNHAPSVAAVAAEAEVDDPMNHAPGEAAVAAECACVSLSGLSLDLLLFL